MRTGTRSPKPNLRRARNFLLAFLLDGLKPLRHFQLGESMSATQIKKVSWWMERFADWMIANPDKFLKDAARELNVSQSWLSIVKNSDAFKSYWTSRSEEASGVILTSIREKLTATTEMALDALNEKLAIEAPHLSRAELLEIAEKGLDKLGYGASKSIPAPVVNVQNITVSSHDLAEARRKIHEMSGQQNVNPIPLLTHEAEEKVA